MHDGRRRRINKREAECLPNASESITLRYRELKAWSAPTVDHHCNQRSLQAAC